MATTSKTISGTKNADRLDMKSIKGITKYTYMGSSGDDLYVFKGDGKETDTFKISDKLGANTLVFDPSTDDFKITGVVVDEKTPANNAILTNKGKLVVGTSKLQYLVAEKITGLTDVSSAIIDLAKIKSVLDYMKTQNITTGISLTNPPAIEVAYLDPKPTDATVFKNAIAKGILVKNALPTITQTDPTATFKGIEKSIVKLPILYIDDANGDSVDIKFHTEGGKIYLSESQQYNDYSSTEATYYQIPFYVDSVTLDKDGKPQNAKIDITVTDGHGGVTTKSYSIAVAKLTTTVANTFNSDLKTAKSLDTGNGANLITVDVHKVSNLTIKNFTDDDRIEISGAIQTDLDKSIKVVDKNVVIDYTSSTGQQNKITIENVAGDLTTVTSIATFNALASTGKLLFYPYIKDAESLSTSTPLNAGDGSYLIADDAKKASNVSIQNFGSDDKITFKGILATDFTKSGTVTVADHDVTISYKTSDNIESVIKLVGLSGDLTTVNSIDTFNALVNYGNISFA